MEEKWLPIPDYEGYYEISNTGKIKSVDRIITYKNGITHTYKSNILSQKISKGYYQVSLSKDNKKKTFYVHRLVALVFLPNPNNLPCVNHKDENPLNNNSNNLEWCTVEYNNIYGERIKKATKNNLQKKKVAMCDLESKEIIKIFDSMSEAGRYLKISHTSISNVINNRRKSAGGYF